MKEFLSRQGVRYVEKNVAADPQAAKEMMRVSGQQGVPVITVDDQVVVGFDQPRLMQLLKARKPRLGASIADAASQARKKPGIPSSGAYVGRVHPGSAAQRAGLTAGDVIVAFGGQPVTRADDVHRLVAEWPQGLEVSVDYLRAGQKRETLIRL